MLLTEGDVHKRHRRIASGAFRFDALHALLPLVTQCTNVGVDGWLAKGTMAPFESKVIDGGGWVELEVNGLLSSLTLTIIGRAAFGVDSSSDAAKSQGDVAIFEQSSSLLDAMVETMLRPTIFIPGWRSLPLQENLRMDRQVSREWSAAGEPAYGPPGEPGVGRLAASRRYKLTRPSLSPFPRLRPCAQRGCA